MVADLMDEDVADHSAERLLMLGPVVKNGPAIKPDAVRHGASRWDGGGMRQAHAMEQAQEIVWRFQLKLRQHVVFGELGDGDGQIADKSAKRRRKSIESLPRHALEIIEGRGG